MASLSSAFSDQLQYKIQTSNWSILHSQLQRELVHPRQVRLRTHETELSVAENLAGRPKLRPVRQVEALGAELQVQLLAKIGVLVDRHVNVVGASRAKP